MDLGQKPHEKKGGFHLFKKKEVAPQPPELQPPNLLHSVNALDERLKILEGRYTDLSRKTQLIDKNALAERKKFTSEMKVVNDELLELKRDMNDMKTKIDMIITELKTCARKDELDSLSKYIDLWEPVNFATRNEVEKMIEEKLSKE